MEESKELFRDFLQKIEKDTVEIREKFEQYHSLLLESNTRVNLISRRTEPEQLWTLHFLDSLLPLSLGFDFNNKTVLDLGTGGGLPGIPLAIINRGGQFLLLDSRQKKILELKVIIKKLDLNNCYPIHKRLEEFKAGELRSIVSHSEGNDVILCRSLKMTESLLKKMSSLLTDGGFILLYKGREVEETWLLKEASRIMRVQQSWGERTILKIDRI